MGRLTKKLSKTSTLHYTKLFFRGLLLLLVVGVYIYDKWVGVNLSPVGEKLQSIFFKVIWIVFVVEMILRFFPSSIESKGCQKQFKRNFIPAPSHHENSIMVTAHKPPKHSTLLVIVSWILLNGAIGILYYTGIIDMGILFIIALAYSVCDMICILFFCPFQEWMLKNKCCGTCRIYNWDFAMMFTPFIYIKSFYTWSLLGIALVLLIQWEVLYKLHPQRFSEATNYHLACENCTEKLCHHKKSLRSFMAKQRKLIRNTSKKFHINQ